MTSRDPQPNHTEADLHVAATDTAAGAGAHNLAACVFGQQGDGLTIGHPGLVPLAETPACESWRGAGPATTGSDDAVFWRSDGHLLFGHITAPADDLISATEALYGRLFACLNNQQFPHLLRIWNFLPQINEGEGDAERYKAFCAGRARAFDESPIAREQYPAATAVGTQAGHELNVSFLAARTPGQRIENPRQTSAPQYPRQYGPRSPRFARATVWPKESPRVLLTSGTASITGHESRHLDDPEAQLAEIWRNLNALQQQTGAARPTAMRVYLRRASDLAMARDFLAASLPADVAPLFLQADICRPELLLEIESVYRF